jgi:hypothetical protein
MYSLEPKFVTFETVAPEFPLPVTSKSLVSTAKATPLNLTLNLTSSSFVKTSLGVNLVSETIDKEVGFAKISMLNVTFFTSALPFSPPSFRLNTNLSSVVFGAVCLYFSFLSSISF